MLKVPSHRYPTATIVSEASWKEPVANKTIEIISFIIVQSRMLIQKRKLSALFLLVFSYTMDVYVPASEFSFLNSDKREMSLLAKLKIKLSPYLFSLIITYLNYNLAGKSSASDTNRIEKIWKPLYRTKWLCKHLLIWAFLSPIYCVFPF